MPRSLHQRNFASVHCSSCTICCNFKTMNYVRTGLDVLSGRRFVRTAFEFFFQDMLLFAPYCSLLLFFLIFAQFCSFLLLSAHFAHFVSFCLFSPFLLILILLLLFAFFAIFANFCSFGNTLTLLEQYLGTT